MVDLIFGCKVRVRMLMMSTVCGSHMKKLLTISHFLLVLSVFYDIFSIYICKYKYIPIHLESYKWNIVDFIAVN